jgi:hypothetical protein
MASVVPTGALQPNSPSLSSHSFAAGWVRFLVPSVADVIFLVLLISLSGSLATRLLGDADIGWHIRNGQQILQTHVLPRTDSFSSTMDGKPWYAWEWLYDLLIASIHQGMGLNGVVFFTALAVGVTFTGALRFTLARGGNLPLTVVLLALAIAASAIHLLARPHVLSWLFALAWFRLLDDWESNLAPAKNRQLFWLPGLMILWVNLHGGFLTGLMLIVLFLAGGAIHYLAAEERGRQLAGRRLKHLSSVSGLCLLATLLNPYGYKLHLHIYRYLSDRFLMNHIQEFHSPDFHGTAEQCFAVLLLITITALALTREKPRISQMLVLIFAADSGLYASRSLPVSSILLMLIIGPILSRTAAGARTSPELTARLRSVFSRCELFASRMAHMEVSLHGHFWPAVALIVGLWICSHGGRLGSVQLMDAHFDGKRFPVEATSQIEQRGIRAPIFCPDSWGGYLIYRLFPQVKVVADDRHDLYGSEFFQKYSKLMLVEPGWQELLDQQHVEWMLIPAKSPLADRLRVTAAWTVVYEDQTAALFKRS